MDNRIRQISWKELEELNKKLADKLNKEKFDCLLCIGSGGLILGKLISDHNQTPLSVIIAESYEKGKKDNHQVQISNIASIRPLKGKILIIDDLTDSGKTLSKISGLLKQNKEISEIKTSVIFIKPWCKFKPDYYLEQTSEWIIFPYEKKEFENGFQNHN